jgi:CRISPR-associated endonuclease/helicase Cas3
MDELLAKSPHGNRRLSLVQHTIDVMDASEWLFGSAGQPTRLGVAWLRFFRLGTKRFPDFHINLLASAAFHDWGKANDGMQNLLTRRGNQVIRHEHLSGLLLALESVTGWLAQRQEPGIDQEIILGATISHHLKADLRTLGQPMRPGMAFQVYTDHPDFEKMLQHAAGRLGLPPNLPKLITGKNWGYKDTKGYLQKGLFDVDLLLAQLKDRRLAPFKKALRQDEARKRMLWSVRAGLIAADAAASGLRREDLPLKTWIEQAFDERPVCTKNFISSKVIGRRIDELIRLGKWPKDDRNKGWTDFQRDCDSLPSRALLLAPCGSGKTLAAWRWIAAQLEQRPAARIIFLYPTRATAKEGFRDYVSWAPEADAALIHGTSAYDLQGMFANPNDPDDPRKESDFEVDRRLYALGYWTRRVFSATVDQFLAFLQYNYGPVCMLPVLADSILVVDEVHSFDRSMWSALKGFLQTFDLPVLCMTATLQENKQQELVSECGLTRYNERPGELKEIASAPRYCLRRTTEAEAFTIVRKSIAGKRILWVVNQVKRAQRVFLLTRNFNVGVPVFCYHSRFRLQDRRERHEEVVKAFRSDSPPALAITTQVCEMSLDMDADLLITECCPISSLIQRMGRCHRNRKVRSQAGDVWIYRPLDEHGQPERKPYDDDALTGIDEFLIRLEGIENRVSQIDLEKALAAAPAPPARPDELSSFLESGPYAMSGVEDFRDIEDFTVSAVLASDIPKFAALQKAKEPTDGLVVPVPKRLGKQSDPRLPSYLAVASDAHYDPLIGFCDVPTAEMGGPK